MTGSSDLIATLGEPPPWIKRYMLFDGAQAAHKFCAARILQKLSHGADNETLLSEADAKVRQEIGLFPSEDINEYYGPHASEDDETELVMREVSARNLEALLEVEAYMWGLGIAGIYHQWERSTRDALAFLSALPTPTAKLQRLDFNGLCDEVKETGFAVRSAALFAPLRLAGLIANTVKHGAGRSFEALVSERRDLSKGGLPSVRTGDLPPQPHHLRVGHTELNDAERAISDFWVAYEGATRK